MADFSRAGGFEISIASKKAARSLSLSNLDPLEVGVVNENPSLQV
jgi:hypothetical protein